MEPESASKKPQKFSDVDRLSSLPEVLITLILSILPTQKAVATQFLSKEWSLRWTELTSLSFDHEDWPEYFSGKMRFEDFLNSVFTSMVGKPIHNLRLRWENDIGNLEYADMRSWISTAVAGGMKVLDLTTPRDFAANRPLLPRELYTSATIESLRLEGSIMVQLPVVISLPRLTSMELYGVTFESHDSVSKLVSGSPVLESLAVETEVWDGNNHEVVFTVSSPTVKRVSIRNEYRNANFVVRVDAPALEYFYLSDYHSSSISTQGLKSVKEVDLDIYCFPPNILTDLLGTFRGVEFLKLSERTVESLSYAADGQLPANFGKVTKLAVQVEVRQWGILVDLIRACKNLEFLDVECIYRISKSDYGGDPSYVPECLSSSLEQVTFRVSDCIKNEVEMLKFMLKNGSCLKRVLLCSSELLYHFIDEGIVCAVLGQPRASEDCELSVDLKFM